LKLDRTTAMMIDQNNFQLQKLRSAICNKWWIDQERFVRFVEMDGFVDYEEFHDFTHQFGLQKDIDVYEAFAALDIEKKGRIPSHVLYEALAPKDEDGFGQNIRQNPQGEEELSPYPSDLMVALVAHNNMKPALMKLVKENLNFFKRVKLVTTGSTGRALGSLGLNVDHLVSSGPLGGDQEIGALITQKKVCAVLFFTDPLSSHPHAADVEALNRICCAHDCIFANNPSTANTLVYSLQHCPFALSRLLGVNPEIHRDSSIVQAYNENQQKVISSISELKTRSTSECSTTSLSKFSSTTIAEGSIPSGQRISSSSSEMKSLRKPNY
jgi:methylglyoxal synthase